MSANQIFKDKGRNKRKQKIEKKMIRRRKNRDGRGQYPLQMSRPGLTNTSPKIYYPSTKLRLDHIHSNHLEPPQILNSKI